MTISGTTIRQRLIFAVVLVTCAVWLGIYLEFGRLQQEQQRITESRNALSDSMALGELSVALARERGNSQALLAVDSADSATQAEADALRASVDGRLQPLDHLFPSGSLLRTQLASVRSAIDQRRSAMDTAFAGYSGVIADINVMASRRLANAMLILGLPYEHINAMREAVEHSGQSRGLLFGALALRDLTPRTLQAVRDEHLLAETALQRAASLAPLAADTVAGAVIGGPRWRAWEQEWRVLLDDPQRYVQQTAPDRWWTVASAAVDTLQRALDQEIEAAIASAEVQITSNQRSAQWAVAAMVVLGLASIGLLLSSVTRVVRGLGRLVGGIEQVTHQRDLGVRIAIEQPDEFGQIGRSVNKLVGTLETLMAEREAQAELDGLTRVINRKGLDRHLAARTNAARKTPEPFGLLVLDVDHFKRINDEFGHLQGDVVLVSVAKVAGQSVRPDDLVGRWGGEEFVVVLSGGGELDLQAAAEKIRIAVASTDFGLGRSVTVSIGASLWTPGMDVQEVFKRADEALYQAKTGGRNRCVVA